MLELTLKGPLHEPIDGSALTPERLAAIPLPDLMSLPLAMPGARHVQLDELFWVQCPVGPSDMMVIRGDCRSIDRLGYGMTGGTLVIDGDGGDRVGSCMRGGLILVAGNAGDEVCSGLRGGTVAIAGNCGDRLGAPLPGERSGIRGGDVIVAGSVGARACQRMRRGTVWIAGDVGDYLAPHMIAGTILVLGKASSHWGMGMRRGSLVFASAPMGETGASLSPGRSLELSFLPLVWNHLRALQDAIGSACASLQKPRWRSLAVPSTRWVERQIGDRAIGGRGEILLLERLSWMSPSLAPVSLEDPSTAS
jgi:formylmethanofuran dehydrogenase subunit C